MSATRAKTATRRPRTVAARTRDESAPASDLSRFPVVGIGASAGGLDALKKFFRAMPADSGMAFVLIPHLDPSHESLMVDLLAKDTAMPVSEARDGTAARPNHVYVIPPNADLAIQQRVLRVLPPSHDRSHTAIDSFLRSLANDQQEWAVGIVLSGTGSHGANGVTAVKAAGGIVMAQTPESAEHDQMPRSAIATGMVDQILPPEEMPKALIRHAAHLPAAVHIGSRDLDDILTVLRIDMKRDFRGYRSNMLLRRVRRRMALCHIDRVAPYVDYLRSHPDEAQALAKDLSISVTAFFRDPDAFHVLERIVIPDLLARSRPLDEDDRPLRVWVPGCATGEEAYSVAILFLEQFAAIRQPVRLQIFATDIDDEALDVAREGLYPDRIGADVSDERLHQFFVKADAHHYQVSKALRDLITFAPQNLIGDAPFSRLDLITCRNVLMYLQPDVQVKVMALFHFALNEGGFLMLGPAESIGSGTNLFEPVSKKWRVYRRIGVGRGDAVDIPISPTTGPRHGLARRDERPRSAALGELMHRALLADFAPAAVLVNSRYEILSVQGPLVEYLEFPPGEWTRDLLSMARPGLRTAIRAACLHALQTHRAVVEPKARVKREGAYVSCTVAARPVGVAPDAAGLLLVTFQDGPARDARAAAKPARRAASGRERESTVVRQLEDELRNTRDHLQGTIDDLQTANEELKGSHEEVLSMNEELQSTNEELETSKEELQSLNEELSTVNSQIQEKVHELDAANNDMANLMTSTDIAVVFLDTSLRLRRFTPPTLKVLNLLPTDVGRPLGDLAFGVDDRRLLNDCRQVIEQLTPIEAVVRAGDERSFLRRVLSYRTKDQRIDGVVVTWVDITQRLAAEAEARRLSAVLHDSNDAVALMDFEGHITGWNRGAERLYGYTEAAARTLRLQDLTPASNQDNAAALLRRFGRGEIASESFDAVRVTKDNRARDVWVTMTLLRDDLGRPDAVVTTDRDITEVKEGLAAREAVRFYEHVIDDLPVGAVLRDEGRLTVNQAVEAITGYERSEVPTLDAWCTTLHGDQAWSVRPQYEVATLPARVRHASLAIIRKDGQSRHIDLTVCRLDDRRALWVLFDMTEHDQAERALRKSEDYLQSIINTAADSIITIDEHGTIDLFNPAAERMFGYTAAEAKGQNVRVLMPPPYADEHDSYLTRYFETGEQRMIAAGREIVGMRKDGTMFPVDLAVAEIGHLRHFVGILRDLSSRRALEWRLAESQVSERRYMARELHDEIGGHMTGIGLLAQALQTDLTMEKSPLAARAQELVDGLTNAHQRLRTVMRGLMPVDAVPEGLMHALSELAKQCETVSAIACRFRCEPPVHVDDAATALHLFRIAQEAVNNAVRHAQPQHITLTLSRTGDRFQIQVIDDGRGLGKIPEGHPGIGLEGMHQRARLLGGNCSVRAADGGGTIVRCWVPVAARQQTQARTISPPQTVVPNET